MPAHDDPFIIRQFSRLKQNMIRNTYFADVVQQVARDTNQQADSVSQTAASAESMSRSINSVSAGARLQAEAITKANRTTQKLNDYLK